MTGDVCAPPGSRGMSESNPDCKTHDSAIRTILNKKQEAQEAARQAGTVVSGTASDRDVIRPIETPIMKNTNRIVQRG
jgi:hypothetical protein